MLAEVLRPAAERAADLAEKGVGSLLSEPDPLVRHIGMERYVNHTSLTSNHKRIATEYSAHRGTASFLLPVHWIERRAHFEFGNATPSALQPPDGMIALGHHPASRDVILPGQPDEYLTAVPTASGRTVLVESQDSLEFLKLHHPGQIGRFYRTLRLGHWFAGPERWGLVQPHIERLACHVMPEPGGTFYDPDNGRGWGMVLRSDPWLHEQLLNGAHLYPLFSILWTDGEGDPRVLRHVAAEAGMSTIEFCRRLCVDLINSYWELAWDLGLIPEYHSQNCLVLVGPGPGRLTVVIRDLTDIRIDVTRREELRLTSPVSSYGSLRAERDAEYYPRRSYAYDSDLCDVLVRRLIELAGADDRKGRNSLFGDLRDHAMERLPPDGYFGGIDGRYRYSDDLLNPHLVHVNESPLLR